MVSPADMQALGFALGSTAAINIGLDFEEALNNPEYIKMEAAAQVSQMSLCSSSQVFSRPASGRIAHAKVLYH